MALHKFGGGRRELAGLYIEEGFVAGGGIEMLALPILPPIVPTSANRLLRLGTAALLGVERSECEGTRPVDASEVGGLEGMAGEEEEGTGLSVVCSSMSPSRDPATEV